MYVFRYITITYIINSIFHNQGSNSPVHYYVQLCALWIKNPKITFVPTFMLPVTGAGCGIRTLVLVGAYNLYVKYFNLNGTFCKSVMVYFYTVTLVLHLQISMYVTLQF